MGSVRMICLNEIELDKTCLVVEIKNNSSMLRRFLDIGIIPGAKIKKVLDSPFGGISAYLITGTTVAIRDIDAKGIMVCYEEI